MLTPSSAFGKNFLPRLGALLDLQPISDVQKVIDENTFSRPIYAGSAIETVKSSDPVKLITVRCVWRFQTEWTELVDSCVSFFSFFLFFLFWLTS